MSYTIIYAQPFAVSLTKLDCSLSDSAQIDLKSTIQDYTHGGDVCIGAFEKPIQTAIDDKIIQIRVE